MIIRIEVTRTYVRPEFLKSELMREGYPVLARTISLELPKGSAIKHGLVNSEGLKIDSRRAENETG